MPQHEQQTDLNIYLKQHIRDIPDFPEPGIMFRDITTLLADPAMFRLVIDEMIRPYSDSGVDKVVVIESRGFIFGTPIAYVLHAGVVPVRKPGKLPGETYSEQYALEYGTNTLEIHQDAIHDHERVIIVDDLLATGGTVEATIRLVERFGGEIVGISVLAELLALKGRARLGDYPVHSLVTY
jgi:adenine phosphoribosyltransferase